jgi:hypothetical protein
MSNYQINNKEMKSGRQKDKWIVLALSAAGAATRSCQLHTPSSSDVTVAIAEDYKNK